jgi:hypothetical protein
MTKEEISVNQPNQPNQWSMVSYKLFFYLILKCKIERKIGLKIGEIDMILCKINLDEPKSTPSVF